MQRTLIVFSLFFAVALAGNTYTYLTYFSDGNCDNFVATRGLTDQDGPYSSSDVSSCREAMQCLLNPASSQCRGIASADNVIRIEDADDGDNLISQFVNQSFREQELTVCYQSDSFPACHFAYFTTEMVGQVIDAIQANPTTGNSPSSSSKSNNSGGSSSSSSSSSSRNGNNSGSSSSSAGAALVPGFAAAAALFVAVLV